MSGDDQSRDMDYESISMLIPKTREGDDDARAQLLIQMEDYLKWMANRNMDRKLQQKVGNSDIVQQTLTRVVEKFDQFKGSSSAEFRGWLKTIVQNEINRVRRKFYTGKRDIGREQHLESANSEVRNPVVPEDSNRTPSSEAIASEQIENFYMILDQLPDDYAEVIRLRSIDRLPFKEIAETMQRSTDSVTKLWYRAVLKFEEHLKRSGNVPFDD